MKRIYVISLLFVVFGILMIFHPKPLMYLDQKWYDYVQTEMGPEKWSKDIYIVAIDDHALNRYGRWPFDRKIMAELIDAISEHSPAVIGLDISFSESSESDEAFASSVFYAGNVIGSVLLFEDEGKGKNEDEAFYFPVFSQPGLDTSAFSIGSFVGTVDSISSGFLSRGHFKFNNDFDNVVRHYKPFYFFKDRIIPGMVFEMYRAKQGFGMDEIAFDFSKGIITASQLHIPIDPNASMLIRYLRKPGLIPTISMNDVMDGKRGEEFEDAYVLVGMTGAGLHDYRPTPISGDLAGIEVQATVLNNLVTGNFLRPMGTMNHLLGLILMFTLGALFFIVNREFSLTKGMISLGVIFLIHFSSQILVFILLDHKLPFTIPNFFYVILFGYMLGYYYLVSSKGAREMKRILSHYLSPNVMQELIKDPEMVKLGGKKYKVAVIFGDVAGFTTFSESHPPEEVVYYLNQILTRLTNCVFEYNGTLDKYIGDCIMGFWGAPLPDEHACDHAVEACIAMIDDIKEFNKTIESDFYIGIGINFGDAVIGNMGSEAVYDYTAMGDTVNTASRLEGVTRTLNNALVINSKVYDQLSDEFKEKFVKHPEKQTVKGKAEGLTVYKLKGYPLKDV